MKELQKNFLAVVQGYIDDYGVEALIEELFDGQTAAEVFYDMYELGGIPEDKLEKFLSDDEN